MISYIDKKYNFVEWFNEDNGLLIRSNVIENMRETDIVPSRRSFPELLDIGIMGSCHALKGAICSASGIDCYQSAPTVTRPNMELKDYVSILEQCKGKVFQVALGGAGDPNKHKDFEEILKSTRDRGIVPNMTTSGYMLTAHEISLMKKYCGAVAVSFYSVLCGSDESNPQTISAIEDLLSVGCLTNVHYVVSRKNIDELIFRLKNDLFPKGINALIILLYKPVGLAKIDNVLTSLDDRYIELLSLVESKKFPYKIGFDSCQSPALQRYTKRIAQESIEFCEATRFSMYIDCMLQAYPCSFGIYNNEFSVDLHRYSLKEAWDSKQFELFRKNQSTHCEGCDYIECRDCGLGMRFCDKY